MRYAIISDIHANLEALSAVLDAAERLGAERIVCLGDIVGYYANPTQCVDCLRGRGIECVRGNHDSVAGGLREPGDFSAPALKAIVWTRRHLPAEYSQYLASLPLSLVIDNRFVMVHAGLHPQPNDTVRIRNERDAGETLRCLPASGPRLCFCGHTHSSVIYARQGGTVTRHSGEQIELVPGASYLINPGSVGQPRDGDDRASFAIYDSSRASVRFHRELYDRRLTREKAIAAGTVSPPHILRRSAQWLRDRALGRV